MRVAVLTVSDRASAGVYEDHSGPALVDYLSQRLSSEIVATGVVPDDRDRISGQLRAWCDGAGIDLIVTTGGTGVAPRDITPEATADVIEREVPGLAEAMRAASRDITPYGMLSRGRVGIRGQTLIINLPGSPKGAVENLRVIAPVLPHAIALLREESGDHASHHFPHHHVTA
ncbi:MAG: MogA/MoaB family molybdenum cofactor biosynthesis protein [Anaerolineae bacterium]|nr:MogA/MoaB family molybdenum cofactor biosynthesis protein [Anaerolineae bacterium]